MQPNVSMQPLFTSFSHQIQSNASTAPLPQQPNMLAVQIPYHLGNMGGPPLIPQSNPLVFPQNNVVGVGHMFPANGQFCNLQSQPPHIFPPPPQTLMSPQLGLPFFGNPQFGAFGKANPSMPLNSASGPSQQQHQPWSHSQSQQANSVKHNQANVSNTSWKSGSGQNLSRNPKRGFQKKSQFHRGNSGQRNFGFQHQQHNTKGYGNERAVKFGQSNHMNPPKEKKRSLALTYTDEEVQQWREERRRNYPTKANKEKKLAPSSSKVIDREAKIRREQLKEILAKQAELGVEVAEIPSHYLSDSQTQGYGNGRKENTRPLNKRGRFQNKHNKRGRHDRKDPATKKQKLLEKNSSKTPSSDKRKPTLLQKLLSKDVRKDKSSLLQVLRFTAMNSFFKDWPEKPLKFPAVIVKESGCTEEVVEDKGLIMGKDVSEESSRLMAGNCDDVDKDNDNDKEEMKKQNSKGFDDDYEDDDVNGSIHVEDVRTEEEGEIID